MLIDLYELDAWDLAAGAGTTHRFASERFNPPDAPGDYLERVVEPLTFGRQLAGVLGPEAAETWGELRLANPDGALDAIAGHALAGRQLTRRIVEHDAAYSTSVVVFRATMAQAEPGWSVLSVPLRDRLHELDGPLNETTYAGDNALPEGLEGTADDIKGRQKPVPGGAPLNVEPVFVNTSRLIGQFNDGSGADLAGLFDGGVALTRGADYTSQSDMETNAPAAGQYRVWPGGGYFRLGSSPAFVITCDVIYGTAADRTAAQTTSRFAQRAPTIGAGDVSSADVTALDAANASQIGWWPPDGARVRDGVVAALEAAGAWGGFDRLGVLRMARVVDPAGETAAATLRLIRADLPAEEASDGDLLKVEPVPPTDDETPVWQFKLEHKRVFSVQRDGLDANITAARRALIREEWRREVVEDASVRTAWPGARSLTRQSHLVENGGTEATRLGALLATARRRWRAEVQFGQATAQVVDLGSIVKLVAPRYGLDAGKNFLVTAIDYDPRFQRATLGLWG